MVPAYLQNQIFEALRIINECELYRRTVEQGSIIDRLLESRIERTAKRLCEIYASAEYCGVSRASRR